MCQTVAELVHVAREVLIDIGIVSKIYNKRFVFGVRSVNQIESGLVYRGPLLVHGTGVIDDQGDRDRDVLVLEAEKILSDIVFEDLEIFLFQILNEFAGAIEDGDVERDFLDVAAEDEPGRLLDHALVGSSRGGFGVGRADRVVIRTERTGRGLPGSSLGRGLLYERVDWHVHECDTPGRGRARQRGSERSFKLVKRRIVTGTGMDGEGRQALRRHQLYLHFTPLTVALHALGVITEHILVAQFSRDFDRNVAHVS